MTSPDSSADDQSFEQTLAEVERSLQTLKDRYAQVKADQERQKLLQEQLTLAEQEHRRNRSQALKTEIKRLKKQLEELEIALESQLFSWKGLQEAFWMAVRFGGIGVIIGWVLKAIGG